MNTTGFGCLKFVTHRLLSALLVVTAVVGCGKQEQFKSEGNQTLESGGPEQTPAVNPAPPSEANPNLPMSPLLWESNNVAAKKWSEFVFSLFKTELNDTLNAADDMVRFCPQYNKLIDSQKINVWGMLISAMSKYESNFLPTSRMKETTMGTDPVTGLPVYSEGLLQLSYQDITGWSFCRFDWNKDKNLAPNDPKKTILDPYINLECGTKILSEQVARHHKIVIDHGAYWAVIKENGKYQKINQIAALVQTLKFCK